MSNVDMKHAKLMFNTMKQMMDDEDWKYSADEENLTIKSGLADDLDLIYYMSIDAEREMVRLWSTLPFTVPEDKRVDCAVAACVANNGMIVGSFQYDISDGEFCFKAASSFAGGSRLSKEAFKDIMFLALSSIKNYNDRFFMVAKGMMTLQQFIEKEGE